MNSSNDEEREELNANLKEVQKYLDNIGEKYFVLETMDTATYQKLKAKYTEKKGEILHSLDTCNQSSSNLDKFLEKAMNISANTPAVWSSGPYQQRECIQKVIFPEGVYYNLENEAVRTGKVNCNSQNLI